MRVWLAKLGEPLPIDGSERLHRCGILAGMLAEQGHEVTWWTSTFDHYRKRQRFSGDHVVALGANYRIGLLHASGYRVNASLARVRHDRRVAELFAQRIETETPPDIILCSFPTPELAAASADYGKRHRIPTIVDIRDWWPDAFVDLAPSGTRWLARLALRLVFGGINRHAFREASGLVATSTTLLDWGLRCAGRQRQGTDGVFYLGSPRVPVHSAARQEAKRHWLERGLRTDLFTCCFVGAINRHFNLGTVISAAREMESCGRYQFVLCGTGPYLQRYQELARGLTNVMLPGWINQAQIAALMDLSAVGLTPYAGDTSPWLPNKLFDYLAGGLPVISSVRGEMEQMLATYECGITYDANNAESFVKAVRALYDDPQRRRCMAENAHRVFEERFSADKTYPAMIEHLVRVAGRRSAGTPSVAD